MNSMGMQGTKNMPRNPRLRREKQRACQGGFCPLIP